MRRLAPVACALCVASAATLPARLQARAQGEPEPKPGGLSGVISGSGFTKIKIAVPEPAAEPPAQGAAREIAQTIRDDLAFSGYFDVIDPALYPLAGTSREASVEDKWSSLGAAAVVSGRFASAAGKVALRARLVTTAPATTLFDRRYGGPSDLARRVAHQVADDIVQQLTGQPGIALTWIAFVSKHGAGKELYLM